MTSRWMLVSVAAVAALGARGLAEAPKPDLAKRKDPPKTVPKEAPPSERFRQDMELRLHMHDNFDLLRAIERLLIRGNLQEATRFATAIAEVPDAPTHGPYAAQAVLVRDRAAAVARATTIDQACKLEAKLAAACGSCHVDTGVVPEFRSYPAAPPDVQTLDGRMARHRWAADRLWEGIVGGADEPWHAGLDVLAAAPFDWGDRAKERVKVARDLQRLAEAARKHKVGDSVDARAGAYGEILSACAACHTEKPTPPPSPPPPSKK